MDDARRTGWPLFLVSAAQFVLQLDFSIVNIALPTIQRELGFAPADLQWIVTGYAMTFGSLLLLGGRLGDLGGRRRLLLTGLAAFGVTSLAAGLAQDPLWLIASRVAQGASAALVAPAALAMVSDLYPDASARTRALGIYQGGTAAGASAGIVLGGVLTQYVGWRAIFLVNPPVIVILAAAMHRVLPPGAGGRSVHLDVPGAVAATASVAALIYGLSQGQQHGFTSALAIGPLAAAVVLAAAFSGIERRSRSPLLPFAVLRDVDRCAALVVMLLAGAVVAGYVYFVSLYLQRVLGFSAILAGLCMVPSTLTVLVTSTFLTRRLLARFPPKVLLLTALAFIGLGQVWLSQITTDGSYQVNVLGGLLLSAFGMGVLFPVASVAVTAGMPPDQRGLAGGLFTTAQQVGQAVGLAVLATIAAAQTAAAHGSLVSGYRASYLIAVGIVAAAIVLALPQRTRPAAEPGAVPQGARPDRAPAPSQAARSQEGMRPQE
ncbi:MAG: MFS transporter [Planctomycetaceae bacterium]|nr:MFS transporter [Planctomycetaceae bacterium]